MASSDQDLDHVAVIGMAGRFPGAPDLGTFWQNLTSGTESISHLSTEDVIASGVDPELARSDNYVPAKGVLGDADKFDAGFFGFSPREAEILDPQHRVFLETAWEALETAGYDPRNFDGRIGVFAGSGVNSYLLFNLSRNHAAVDAAGIYQMMLANDKDFLATRVAYKLGLTGPGIGVQTACSTSLTAIHLASQSLLSGECDIAIAGGVTVTVPLEGGHLYEKGGILSPDGHCRAFAADAEGTVAGNGAGVVVLRRLDDARDSGDVIDAVIRGTAVNNDGSLKAGYTAPSTAGQAQVIAEALAVADVDPATVGYVEAHGTGTPLGDPIEVAALTRAYREHTDAEGFCAIGSVKSNVGHLDAAAGVTAVIKTVLALRHDVIPPSISHTEANPALELETSPFFVATEAQPWPSTGTLRRAGVSSFGIGGTNVHAVIEQGPDADPAGDALRSEYLLPLSAKSPAALAEGARRLADYLEREPEAKLGDVAYTLACRRAAFDLRVTVTAKDTADAVRALRKAAEATPARASHDARVAFLFPGQGAQYAGMARDLYSGEAVFTEEFDRCAGLFAEHGGADLRELLFPAEVTDEASARLERTENAQRVLFAVEYSLAKLWESRGVRPEVMAGHSVGEFAAACIAGVFSLSDAVRLVAARARLVQEMPGGSMLSVFLPESEVDGWLSDGLGLAAANSSELSVVSGSGEAIDALEKKLKAAGIGCRRLHTSHAFHSADMDGAVAPFVEEVRKVTLNPPAIPFHSGVTGARITDEDATDPRYWGRQLREPVRFADALDALLADPAVVPVEVGPGQTLASFARQHRAWTPQRTVTGSLRHPNEQRDDREFLLASVGTAWGAGVEVDWASLYPAEDHRLLRLPTYAFQRERYWIDPDPAERAAERAAAVSSMDDWFYAPGWRSLPPEPATTAATDAVWAVFGADNPLGAEVARRLTDAGATVIRAGEGLEAGERTWMVGPGDRARFASVVTALAETAGERPIRVVHAWGVAESSVDSDPAAALAAARHTGFDSLVALAQALGEARPQVPVSVDVLCQGVFGVTGTEDLRPENATVLGATTVLPQEVSGAACRVLDVTGSPSAAAVVDVLLRPDAPVQLALRGRQWWHREFDAIRLGDEGSQTSLRDGGTYLITGGLGGIGLAMAEVIARAVDAPVLGLLGRSAFPAEAEWDAWVAEHGEGDATSVRIRQLRKLTAAGARVLPLSADVTDEAAVSEAVAELRAVSGALHGVIHAAGVGSKGMLATKTAEEASTVLAAKTLGTLVLDRVTAEDGLDFLLLCSSVTAVLGGPGQSDYGAANAFLDAFAERRRQEGAPVTAIAWDTWHEVGMAAGLSSKFGGTTATEEGEPTSHPMLRRVSDASPGARTYLTRFSTADHWIVDDHRIHGHGLVPGTAYLELIRAAAADQAPGKVIEVRDVVYPQPVVVPDGQVREVYTSIEVDPEAREGAPWRFSVRSRKPGGGWTDHAMGSVSVQEREEDVVRDLSELKAKTNIVHDTQEKIKKALRLDRFEKGGPIEFSFGPRWECMDEIRVGKNYVFATLRLADEFHDDLEGYALHPALFDVAGGTARVHATETYYLPFTYRKLRVFHRMTPLLYAWADLSESEGGSGETLTCDLDIYNPDGLLLASATGFSIKRINDVTGLRDNIEAGVEAGAEPEPKEQGTLSVLAQGITRNQGQDAFARILAAPAAPGHLVVAHQDFAGMRALAASITPASLAAELERLAPAGSGGGHPRPDLDTPYAEPVTAQEQSVAEVWQDVLGIDRVGTADDFFALGGHSLAAVQIGTRIHARFGVELDLRRFFENPTVAGTVELLAEGGGEAEEVPALTRAEEPEAGIESLDELSDAEIEAQLRELMAAQDDEEVEEA